MLNTIQSIALSYLYLHRYRVNSGLINIIEQKMARYHHRRARRPAATEPTAAAPVTTEYRAPTVRLEDKVFTIGSTLDAAKFETVKEELGKHFATQYWSDGADSVAASETLTQPVYDEPAEPDIPKRYIAADGC